MPYLQAITPFWRTILVEVFRMPKSSGKTQPAPSPIPSPRLCLCFPIPDPCFSGLQPPKTLRPHPPTPNSSKNRRWNPLNLFLFNELQKQPVYLLVNTTPHFQAKKRQKHRRNWHFGAKMALFAHRNSPTQNHPNLLCFSTSIRPSKASPSQGQELLVPNALALPRNPQGTNPSPLP